MKWKIVIGIPPGHNKCSKTISYYNYLWKMFCLFSRWYISNIKSTNFWVMSRLPISFSVHESSRQEYLFIVLMEIYMRRISPLKQYSWPFSALLLKAVTYFLVNLGEGICLFWHNFFFLSSGTFFLQRTYTLLCSPLLYIS